MDYKALAQQLGDLFGGPERPRVFQYWDHNHEQSVHILSSEDGPEPGLTSYATLGMSRFDNKLTAENGLPIRVELVAVCQKEFPAMANVLSSCAFNVASGVYSVRPNVIHPDAVRVNDDSVRMKHALLTDPFLWEEGLGTITEPDMIVTFLQVLPVDDAEFEFAGANGIDALLDRFEAAQIDVYDINRPSAT